MRVALAADHAGVELKEVLKRLLDELGVDYRDFGANTTDSVDYPDFAADVARAVASGAYDRGVLVCGSGIGMAIVANKIPGIRAASVNDAPSARLSREHNDANVLTLGARLIDPARIREILQAFLDTPFEGGRHQRRLDKITNIENGK